MLTCGKKVAGQISYAPQNPWIIHSMSNLEHGTVKTGRYRVPPKEIQ
jgi:hypothetical protein